MVFEHIIKFWFKHHLFFRILGSVIYVMHMSLGYVSWAVFQVYNTISNSGTMQNMGTCGVFFLMFGKNDTII